MLFREILVVMDNPITNNQNQFEMSYKSVLKGNIKSVDGSKIKKRNVRVVCHNGNAGKTVQSAITQNSSELFGGYTMNKITTGIDGNKDFTVKFNVSAGAQYFYDKLNSILNDKSVPAGEPEKSLLQNVGDNISNIGGKLINGMADPEQEEAALPAGGDDGGDSGNKALIIAGAAVLVAILVAAFVLWKKK